MACPFCPGLTACYSHSCRAWFPHKGRERSELVELEVLGAVVRGERVGVGSDESGLEQREVWW